MVLFINGSFGVGKTSVARRLVERVPNALLYDAEEVGFMLRSMLSPLEWSGDFQDYPMWRRLVPEVGRQLVGEYRRTLIVPMTIWREDYFQEVVDGFRAWEPDFRHVCLTAPIEVIHERIRRRGEQAEGDWVFDMVPKCVATFESPVFESRLDTSELGVEELVNWAGGEVYVPSHRK